MSSDLVRGPPEPDLLAAPKAKAYALTLTGDVATRDARYREFGTAIWQSIAAGHGPEVANAVMAAFVDATFPSTPARNLQNRIHATITARLDKICSEVAP